MSGVENRFDFLQADARILDIVAHAVGMPFESLDGVFRAGGTKGKIVLEKIIVSVNMGDGENMQSETVVAHEISDRGIGVDHHLIGKPADAVFIERQRASL